LPDTDLEKKEGIDVEPAQTTFTLSRILKQLSAEDRSYIVSLIDKDPLTGVYNRRKFDTDVELVIAMADRANLGTSLLMIDIDHFKRYNDKYGHQSGDEVLRAVTRTIEKSLREYDRPHVYRYGGEEFVVLIPNVTRMQACKIGERIRINVAKYTDVTVSAGISHYKESADNLETLIRCADEALYKAKETGRNKVVLFDTKVPFPACMDS